MRSKRVWASLAGLATAALAIGQAPVFGPEFQVNTTTTSYQYAPSVANVGPASNFVVVWSSDGQDGDHTGAVGRLFDAVKAFPGLKLTVDLERQTVSTPDGSMTFSFEVEAFRKHCLVNGFDDIGLTLQHADDIRAFEAKRLAEQPWLV